MKNKQIISVFYLILLPLLSNCDSSSTKRTQAIYSETFTINGVSFEMMKVEPGTFTMGLTPEMIQDPSFDDGTSFTTFYQGERPTHEVTLTDTYYIGRTEVTQALWKAVMGRNPSKYKGENRPVENVSWNDCQAFIAKLNSLTGRNFRLPTEAEWEFAARGGNNSKHFMFSGSNISDEVAWNFKEETQEVATKQPNELGIFDMSGNVWEWCSDIYEDYTEQPQINPTGASRGSYRVCRGGSFDGVYDPDELRSRPSYRGYWEPEWRNDGNQGFRLALSEHENNAKRENKERETLHNGKDVDNSFFENSAQQQTSPSSARSYRPFSSEWDVRSFLSSYTFVSKDGDRIYFREQGNQLYYNGTCMSSIIQIGTISKNSATFVYKGPYGTGGFAIVNEEWAQSLMEASTRKYYDAE